MNKELNLQIDQEIEVEVGQVAFGGDGVCRIENFVIFVPDVVEGEIACIRITKLKKAFGQGEVVRIVEPSPSRVKPECPVYGVCGGCQYQHISYQETLKMKARQLKDVIQKLSGVSVESVFSKINQAPNPYNYRDSITLKVRFVGDDVQFGYFARDKKTFVNIEKCPIAYSDINDNFKNIKAAVADLENPKKIKEITIKTDGKKTLFYPRYEKPYKFLTKERLCFKDSDVSYRYALDSFFQINHKMTRKLLSIMRREVTSVPGETLFDLYAGTGLFALALAKQFYQVVGVEIDQEGLRCFKENIHKNRIQNVIAVRGSVEKRIEDVYVKFKSGVNSVVVDPPRSGLHQSVVSFLGNTDFRQLIYVSCDPGTLARDLKILSEKYKIKKVIPLDFFPQTKHIETVVVMERK